MKAIKITIQILIYIILAIPVAITSINSSNDWYVYISVMLIGMYYWVIAIKTTEAFGKWFDSKLKEKR